MKVFKQFRGSQNWAAKKLSVNKSTIARYLKGLRTSQMLDEEIPKLADLLIATKGACIDDANGKSVRSRLRRLRARRQKGNGK